MLEQIIRRLGANYIEDTEDIIQDIIEDMTPIACDASNRNKEDTKMFPYIKKAVISEYNARGTEGLLSRSEGSISSQYEDIIEKMRNNIIKNGLRRIK